MSDELEFTDDEEAIILDADQSELDPQLTIDVKPGEEVQPDLIDVNPKWRDSYWKGMPDYEHQDLMPWQTMLVHFMTPKDRAAFAALVQQPISAKTKFIWYPKQEWRLTAHQRWSSTKADEVTPRYPVYVPTKGRWETPQTIRALEKIGVPYYAVVQPGEVKKYESVVKNGKILVLPDDLDGLVPTRNWIRRHSTEVLGAARHWQIDDNIKAFGRFQKNLITDVTDGAIFRAMEDFSDRYENVAVTGPNYYMFAPTRMGAQIPPITLNTRVYSCSLINNAMPHWWRGVYNDDTDLCLRALKDGWCVLLFNAFLCFKTVTMTLKGGNTPIYVGDGRRKMAEELQRQHPDVTTILWKWGRWQHQVDYRKFRENKLIPREDIVVPDHPDNYGMELVPWQPQQDEERDEQERRALEVKAAEEEDSPVDARPRSNGRGRNKLEVPSGPPVLLFLDALGSAEPTQPQAIDNQTAPAVAYAEDLRRRGHRLLLKDGKFFVSEASRLGLDDREQIRRFRAELMALAEPWIELPASNGGGEATVGDRPSTNDADRPSPSSSLGLSLEQDAPQSSNIKEFLDLQLGADRTLNAGIDPNWHPDEPPSLTGIDEIVLNFATTGLEWTKGARPAGVTVSTLDGLLTRFLPFRFAGGNLDEAAVKDWACRELRNKKIVNAHTSFDVHMARVWGIDLEDQGCTFSDVQHTAALLDDHRQRFAIDALAKDYLPSVPLVERLDESRHADYHAAEAAERERFTAQLVGRLLAVMRPQIEKEDLLRVQALEDAVIPVVVEMEKNGAQLDMELVEQYHQECVRRHDAILMELSKDVGFAFEHTVKGWTRLFEKLGLTPSDSYSEKILTAIDHPMIKKGYFASQLASLDSKTFKAYKDHADADGVLHFEINQLRGDEGGTVTGRFSIGYVQQAPNHDNHAAVFGEELFPRRVYKAAEGLCLEGDARQIEYRLFAHHANNAAVLEAYRRDPLLSFHKMTWGMMKAYKADMLYTHQKSFNFAKQYGARSIKLAVMMGFITETEGDEIRAAKRWDDPRLALIHEIEDAYKRIMPESDMLLSRASHLAMIECDKKCNIDDDLHKQFNHRGYVMTLLGRRSRFNSNHKTYIALNRVLQGTGADIMKQKLVELHKERKTTGFLLRLTVHDAVVGDARLPETKDRVAEILNHQSFPELRVPILWEVGVGRTWADCKK
jgi:DNA polymerase I-like protein with 3'-5' exonuclease and polymerase domains